MTKQQAERLARLEDDYVAKRIPRMMDTWGVWCTTSDHWVEFDQEVIEVAKWRQP